LQRIELISQTSLTSPATEAVAASSSFAHAFPNGAQDDACEAFEGEGVHLGVRVSDAAGKRDGPGSLCA
jgi:hypothetical protein